MQMARQRGKTALRSPETLPSDGTTRLQTLSYFPLWFLHKALNMPVCFLIGSPSECSKLSEVYHVVPCKALSLGAHDANAPEDESSPATRHSQNNPVCREIVENLSGL